MPGIVCIVAYRPSGANEASLLIWCAARPTLRKEGLVTDRVPVIVRAKDQPSSKCRNGIAGAIEEAHRNRESWRCGTILRGLRFASPAEDGARGRDDVAGFEPIAD